MRREAVARDRRREVGPAPEGGRASLRGEEAGRDAGRAKGTVTWGSLTAELDVTHGAPRRLLTAAFTFLRDVQNDYRESVGPIVVPAGGATPGTISGAFDVWVQTQATHRPRLPVAAQGS